MIISVLILKGFTNTIEEKIVSFTGHFQIAKFTLDNSFEESPISINNDIYQNPGNYEFVKHIQEYGHKAGLLQTEDEIQGVVLKGVGESYDRDRFQSNITKGRFIQFNDTTSSKEMLISQKIANLLKLHVGDEPTLSFMDFDRTPPILRKRKLSISGIYDTGLEDFDDKIVIGDIALVQRLNNWNDTLVGGFEVFVEDLDTMEEVDNVLYNTLDYDLYAKNVTDSYMQFFDWMKLISKNEGIILIVLTFVACFNMISILLILMMERTQMIGLLKALGAPNPMVRKIFIYQGLRLLGRGLLWGNIIGLGLGAIQYYTHIFPLDPENYYMTHVPIAWVWPMVISINLAALVIIASVFYIPSSLVSRIDPIKSIRFD